MPALICPSFRSNRENSGSPLMVVIDDMCGRPRATCVENSQCTEGKSSTSVRSRSPRVLMRYSCRPDKRDARDVFMMRAAASILDVRNPLR